MRTLICVVALFATAFAVSEMMLAREFSTFKVKRKMQKMNSFFSVDEIEINVLKYRNPTINNLEIV